MGIKLVTEMYELDGEFFKTREAAVARLRENKLKKISQGCDVHRLFRELVSISKFRAEFINILESEGEE